VTAATATAAALVGALTPADAGRSSAPFPPLADAAALAQSAAAAVTTAALVSALNTADAGRSSAP